ncbi:hypothetical protein BDM02DRAFT_3192275 [Thelephora ganbajun]|uniref:Uncharacterized protein n=1 Tax=Thelephora ganbajun TaxID=370292 RepID=A0ACB6Z0L9_THEGA|nr:hypothetical protein BDM02DRAFT_3192275 [Thelephora ganbajun]
MPGGNILQYTQKDPNVGWLMLNSAAASRIFMINVFRTISSLRIQITQDGWAYLGDLGVLGGFDDLSFTRFKLGTACHITLEQANLLKSSPSNKSDVYSLGMPSSMVLTGVLSHDYNSVRGYYSLKLRIRSGKQPPRPMNPSSTQWLQGSVWGMITTCWSEKPNQ